MGIEDRPLRVLLIEDSPGDARLIQELLAQARGASFDMERADRLSAGLERLAAGGIDAVLLDLGLPDSYGLETFLKVHTQAPGTPVIVLTGLDDEAVAVRAAHEGAQDYLVKGHIESNPLARSIRYAIQRKGVEEALRESEERLHTVINNAPIVLFALDREGKFTLSEGKGLAALGLRLGEVEGRSVFDIYRDVPEIIANVRRALSGESFTGTAEVNGLAYETHYAPIRGQSGGVAGVIGVATDTTERVRAERALRDTIAELERKTEELESFAYSVSHDLKEPLRTLEAFSQFLLEDYASCLDEQGRDYLTRLGKASARLKEMIEDLLVLCRLGRRPSTVERVAVSKVVADLVAAMQVMVEEKSARVEVEADLPDILGDTAHLQQIFGNLIGNALKFTRDERPLVKVGVRDRTGGMVTFYVQDNGIGIDPQFHERIFEVFQRLHRREEYEGTGAGLAIVKRAVEALDGRVWVESEPGAGATFLFTLPLWQGVPAAVVHRSVA